MPANRRRTSIAADKSLSFSKMVRIAAVSSPETMNIVGNMAPAGVAGKGAGEGGAPTV
jgi:hypothetical protein